MWEINTGSGRPFHAHHTQRSLWASDSKLSAAQGGVITFDLLQGTPAAGDVYFMLCSASGTTPGFNPFGVHIPLNPDPFLQVSANAPNNGIFIQTLGVLGATGNGLAGFGLPPGLAGGYTLDFAYLLLEPVPLMLKSASNPVPVQVF